MILVRSLLFNSLFYASMVIFGVLLVPIMLLSQRATWFVSKLYVHLMLEYLQIICGVRSEVRGTVPTGNVLVAAKHQSFLDSLILFRALETPCFVIKSELRFTPVFSWYMTRMGSITIDRSGGGKSVHHLVTQAMARLPRLGQLLIYPQGTRVAPGHKKPYRVGIAVLYTKTGLACIPAATNAGAFWGRNTFLRKPGTATVEFLPALSPDLPQDEVLAKIEIAVEDASEQLFMEAENSRRRAPQA